MNFLLPLITLVLCAGFLLFQQVSVRRISTGNSNLQTRIDQVRQAGTPSGGARPAAAATKGGTHRATSLAGGQDADGRPQSVADIDLDDLAQSIMEAEASGGRNFEVMVRLKSLVLEATPEELTELIRRTAELDVPLRIKENLVAEMVDALAEHDPKLALEAALNSAQLDVDRQRGRISRAFAKWAKEDPAGAADWFDRETAKGSLESKSLNKESGARTQFEGALIAQFLDVDPTRARERLLQLAPEERQQVLSRGDLDINGDNAQTYAQLVRESIDEAERGNVLGSAAGNIVRKDGFQGVLDYAEQIEATPTERAGIAKQVAGQKFERMGWQRKTPSDTDLAELHTFLQSEAPDDASRITGESLARFGRSRDNFETALGLVEQLHTNAPSDDLVAGFLQSSHLRGDSREAARELAGKIQDPQRREEALARIK